MLVWAIVSFILMMMFFTKVQELQQAIFVPKEYLLFTDLKLNYVLEFLQLEIMIIMFGIVTWKNKIKIVEFVYDINWFLKKHLIKVIAVNILLLYIVITSVTVVTKEKIIEYKFYNPKGISYDYSDIKKVETGFYMKKHMKKNVRAGDFYYRVEFENGRVIDFSSTFGPYNETYLEVEIFDKFIMENSSVEKNGIVGGVEKSNLGKKYIDRLLRVIGNN